MSEGQPAGERIGGKRMKKEEAVLIERIKGKRPWLLNFHKLLLKHDPEMLQKWDELYSAGKFKERSISAREKELVDLGINVAIKWGPGIEIHTKKALDLGVTEKEIVEIFSLTAMTTGIPCMMYAADVYEKFKKNGFRYSFPQFRTRGSRRAGRNRK